MGLGLGCCEWLCKSGLRPGDFGIALYGLGYFIVHEIIIHQRLRLFRRSNHPYIRAIRMAHKIHHKTLGKHGASSFGMLIVSKKYFKK